MKIAVTGARGKVGQAVVKIANGEGHFVYEINRANVPEDDNPLSEHRKAEATDYGQVLEAFKGADAVIHLAAIPDPLGKEDHKVHNNNVQTSYNAMRAAAELGIKRFSLASSVNATGLVFSRAPIKLDYFPLDEEHGCYPSDPYALSKQESEIQADSLVRQFPFLRVASLRIHEVAPLTQVKEEHDKDPEFAKRQLWAWVHPEATARACLAGVLHGDWEGHERFNIVAPETTRQEPSIELAKKHYPTVPIKGDLSGRKSFFSIEKAERVLGWRHHEKE